MAAADCILALDQAIERDDLKWRIRGMVAKLRQAAIRELMAARDDLPHFQSVADGARRYIRWVAASKRVEDLQSKAAHPGEPSERPFSRIREVAAEFKERSLAAQSAADLAVAALDSPKQLKAVLKKLVAMKSDRGRAAVRREIELLADSAFFMFAKPRAAPAPQAATQKTPALVARIPAGPDTLVTFEQIAVMVMLLPPSLRRHKHKLTKPDYPKSGSRPARWSLNRLRPILREAFPDARIPDK